VFDAVLGRVRSWHVHAPTSIDEAARSCRAFGSGAGFADRR
jgi:hypothetical protein